MFEGLYYPYSRALDPLTLKRAALMFDRCYFVDGESDGDRRELILDHEIDPSILDDYEYLHDQGIIEVLNPQVELDGYEDLLTASVLADLEDVAFGQMLGQRADEFLTVLPNRIPPSLWESEISTVDGRSKRLFEDRSRVRGTHFHGTTVRPRRGRPSRYRDVVDMPFGDLSSLRLGETLVLTHRHGVVPFSDSSLHRRLLQHKLEVVSRVAHDNPDIVHNLNVDAQIALPKADILMQSIASIVTDEALERTSLEDLVAFRKAHAGTLDRLHGNMAAIASEIPKVVAGAEYDIQLKKLVDREIMPQVIAAADETRKGFEEAFGEMASDAVVKAPVAVIALYFGVSPLAALGIFAVWALPHLTETLKTVLLSKRSEQRNGYTYLLELQNMMNR